MADAVAHGTVVGVNNGHAKLDEAAVRAIRARRFEHAKLLAAEFGVHMGTVRNVWAGRVYGSVI